MSLNCTVTSALSALASTLCLAGAAQAAAPVYTIREIKAPNEMTPQEARAISSHGRLIVGSGAETDDPNASAPFITKRRKASALEQPCDHQADKECSTWAAAVNDLGEAVGTMSVGAPFQNRYFAQYWGADGRVVDLDPQLPCNGAFKHTYANAINNLGAMLVVLDCADSGGIWKRSYVYQNGQLTPIGSLGGDNTNALAINNRGQVVGYGVISNGSDHHSFVWENGVIRDLGDIDGSQKNIATDINDQGHAVVGTTGTGWIGKNYIIDVATGAKQLIAHCHGGDGPSPMAINNRDEVALSDYRSESWLYTGGECHAFADVLDADSRGWTQLVITDIDDEGVVVGYGRHHKEYKAFIAKPASASH